jgi:SAM-dependent methyltransferase
MSGAALPPLANPDALVRAMGKAHRRLTEDLQKRAADPRVEPSLREAHAGDRAQGRTGEPWETYRDAFCDQVAASWVLCTVFARTLEDRGYLPHRLAGPGAADRLAQFRAMFRFLGERDYLLHVFDAVALLPGGREVFGQGFAPLWRLAPTSSALGELLDELRATEGGVLRFSFGRPVGEEHDGASTRYLGDLYQDLNEGVRKRYALLQTPEFVERFLLENTLDPAIRERGIAVTVLDPACGSGHMLLGAYDRLYEARRRVEPGLPTEASARTALGQVYGVDLNPYAAAVARFRLVLSYLDKAGIPKLEQVSKPLDVQVYVGDSLLAGLGELQGTFGDVLAKRGEEGAAGFERGALLSFFDPETDKLLAKTRFDVVVANPPYITEKDATKRELIRKHYKAASGTYSLAAPFAERMFQLGNDGAFTGQITANSFMKREFGKRLVEEVLPNVDLTEVLDTSGAYVPGHGTPTVILFGRARRPVGPQIRVVLGSCGEPTTPDVPAKGRVWSSIAAHHGKAGYIDEFISVADMGRNKLAHHPWSLGGGGAAELKELLEHRAAKRLEEIVEPPIGRAARTGADEVMVLPRHIGARFQASKETWRDLITGEDVRDWLARSQSVVWYPYNPANQFRAFSFPMSAVRHLWPWRTTLAQRATFQGVMRDAGLAWYEYMQYTSSAHQTPLSITFPFVATHNHFILDRGGHVFKQTAPIVKLAEGATEEDHLRLLGHLNSSTACFWMKQVAMNKGATSDKGVLQSDPEKFRFEFDGTKLRLLPVPNLAQLPGLRALAAELDAAGSSLARNNYAAAVENETLEASSRLLDRFAQIRAARDALAARMVALQEELDWVVYEAFELIPYGHPAASPAALGDLSSIGELAPDERPYRLKQHGRALPAGGSSCAAARLRLIQDDPMLSLLETPDNKRRWYRSQGKFSAEMVTDDDIAHDALESWLLDRAEAALHTPHALPIRTLAHTLHQDPKVRAVCEVLTNSTTYDLETLLGDLLSKEAVASAKCQRYTEAGLETRAAWERTWDLQRREDAGETVTIDPPPKYDQKDFENAATVWRLRGKLDVPKERFIAYPTASPPPGAAGTKAGLVFGWAGWDHLQQLEAAVELWQAEMGLHAHELIPRATRREREEALASAAADEALRLDAAARERLHPLLQTMADLLPWVRQWHDEDGATADDFDRYVAEQALRLEVSLDEARAYRRPARQAARGRRTTAAAPRPPAEEQLTLGLGPPARGGTRSAALSPDDVISAVRALDAGIGAPVAELGDRLGASAAAVKKTVDALVEAGRLVERKKRPRLVSVA